jgi:putative hemolysin
MSERISPRFSPRVGGVFKPAGSSKIGALVLAGLLGCGSAGTQVGTGGAQGIGTGGSSNSTGGSGIGSGGFVGAGSGGLGSVATGGSAPGTGGDQSGLAGNSPTGSGGTLGSGGGMAPGGKTGSGGGVGTGGSVGSGGGGPLGGATGSGGGVAQVCPKPAGQICHEFFANDNARNQINYVNEFDPTKNWTKSVGDTGANSPRTIEIVSNPMAKTGKAILVSLEKGFGEFDFKDGTSLVKVSNKSSISGACRLPDGTTALGNDNTIIVVNSTGTEIRRFAIPAGDNLRAINRNPVTGHYWFTKTTVVYEVTDTGTVTWMADMGAGTKGYAVWWRDGGGAYATTGDPSTVVELGPDKQILNTVGGKAMFTSIGLDFFSGFVRLPSGDYVVANWLGHLSAPAAATPHLVQFTPQNKVVWQWGNQTLARQITNVYIIQ